MATNGQPTPPPSDQPTTATATTSKPATATAPPAPPPPAESALPLTSALDDGTAKRPRDARLIHAVLSNYGITTYQERVPLQLLDFAYRYTSGILSDALRLASEGYTNAAPTTGGGGGRGGRAGAGGGGGSAGGSGGDESEKITVTSLRQAIAARQGYTFHSALPKEFLLEQAMERNRIALPPIAGQNFGVQLPPEKFCLTGVGWKMREEWEDEVREDERFGALGRATDAAAAKKKREGERSAVVGAAGQKMGGEGEDEAMGGMDEGREEEEEDDEGAGRMEDVFGEDAAAGDVPMEQD